MDDNEPESALGESEIIKLENMSEQSVKPSDTDSQLSSVNDDGASNVKLQYLFLLNTVIWLIGIIFYYDFVNWVPQYSEILMAILVISTITEIIIIALLARIARRLNKIRKIDGRCVFAKCQNKVINDKQFCSEHMDYYKRMIRRNRIVTVLGLIVYLIYYLLTK